MAEIIGLNGDASTKSYPSGCDFVVRSRVGKAEKEAVSDCYSLKLVTNGQETYRFGQHKYTPRSGEFLLLKPETRFTALVGEAAPAEGLCIYFTAATLERVASSLVTSSSVLLQQPDDSPTLVPPWEEVINVLRSGRLQNNLQQLVSTVDEALARGNPRVTDCLLMGVAEELLRDNAVIRQRIDRLPVLKTAVRNEIFRRLQKAVTLMHREFSHQVTLPLLAFEASLSVFHFSRLFRQVYGVSPCQYLQKVRIEEAGRLLITTQSSVGDIALRCGFPDHTSFCRVFKQTIGLTPGAFRNSKI